MSWRLITDEWRLKLLALGLAILMLGAVAFAQNPPTTNTKQVGIVYKVAPGIVLMNPPTKVTVTYTGLSDVIQNVNANNTVAFVDASHASPGGAVRLNVTVSSITGVTVTNPPPIVVAIDTREGKDIPVQVSYVAAAGWSVTKAVAICNGQASACTVHFDGPATWETNLSASVLLPGLVNYTGPRQYPTAAIQLHNSNGLLDLTTCRTQPCASLDETTASIEISAVPGSTVSTVPLLDSPPSHGPPPGYRVTAITISPLTVVISGDPAGLGRIQSITLPPVDLSHSTADATFLVAIPYPDGTTGTVANAKLIYLISANPNISPGP